MVIDMENEKKVFVTIDTNSKITFIIKKVEKTF